MNRIEGARKHYKDNIVLLVISLSLLLIPFIVISYLFIVSNNGRIGLLITNVFIFMIILTVLIIIIRNLIIYKKIIKNNIEIKTIKILKLKKKVIYEIASRHYPKHHTIYGIKLFTNKGNYIYFLNIPNVIYPGWNSRYIDKYFVNFNFESTIEVVVGTNIVSNVKSSLLLNRIKIIEKEISNFNKNNVLQVNH